MTKEIICPGCGLTLPDKNFHSDERLNASGECRELYDGLAVFTLSQNDPYFIHQLIVDCYAAQHSGGITKNITTVFALIGLCLVNEHGYTGKEVQMVHMKIPKQTWPALLPPAQPANYTVAEVLKATTDEQKVKNIKTWSKVAWESWSAHHDWIRIQLLKIIWA